MDKQSAILYPCLQALNSKLELFFSYLSDMQFNAALTLLQMAPKQAGGEFLQKHYRVWEELIHPFKLLIDCERQYYEWGFLQHLPAYNDGGSHLSLILNTNSSFFSSNSAATGGSTSKEKKQKQADENTLKYMYHQIPLGLKKTMSQLQKFVGSYHQQQQQQQPPQQPIMINPNYQHSHLNYQQQSQHSSPTHQSHQHYNAASAYNSPTPAPPKLASSQSSMNFNTAALLPPSSPDIPRFLSLLHLMDELIGGYIMLKITMIQLYQNLNAPYSSIARIKEMNWTELQRVCEKLRSKCEKAFVHPYLLELKQKILDPELFLLEQVGMIESDAAPLTVPLSPQPTPSPTHHGLSSGANQPLSPTSPSATPGSHIASPYGSTATGGSSSGSGAGGAGGFLPSYNWKHCMFVLLRIKAEQTKWMNRIIARDREINGTTGALAGQQSNSTAALTAGGGNAAGAGAAGGLNQASLARKTTTGLSTLLTGSGGNTAATTAGAGAGGNSALKYSLLSNPTQSAIFPSILYWIHQLHHSLFCKSTLLFHNILSRTAGEIRGEDFLSKINNPEKVEVNYLNLFEKLIKKLTPNCYSVSIVMDCSGMEQTVSAETPLVLHDAAVLREGQLASNASFGGQQDSASPAGIDTTETVEERPSGGLSNYPVLFHWPPNKPLLEKWNLVSTLISKQDLMDSMHSYSASQTPPPTSGKHSSSSATSTTGTQLPIPKQTNSYILAIGPSNLPSDLMIWDFESEFLASQQAAQHGNQPPPPTVSYFICKLDVQKNVYIVITFQNSVSSAHDESGVAGSAGNASSGGGSNVSSPLPTVGSYTGGVHGPSPSTPLASSAASVSLGPSASPSSNANSGAFLPAAARKRVFDLLLQEVVPILHKLRHMHVFQQMQPSLGKRKN